LLDKYLFWQNLQDVTKPMPAAEISINKSFFKNHVFNSFYFDELNKMKVMCGWVNEKGWQYV
jgi:hypothetical protein